MKKWTGVFLAVLAVCLLFPLFGCGKEEPQRNFYEISAAYDEGALDAQMNFTYFNQTGEEISHLKFNLYGNAYREDAEYKPVSKAYEVNAYYAGESYGDMQILTVSDCLEWNIGGEDKNILAVTPTEPISPGESASFTIEYTVKLANVNHRTGITQKTVNLGNFYPILCVYENGKFYECNYYSSGDPFYSECADYGVTFTADAKYTVASSGKCTAASAEGTKKTYTYTLKNARDFAIVLSDSFTAVQAKSGNVAVAYYFTDDAQAEKKLELISRCISYFGEQFGQYPYETYCAVQTGFCYGGMEYPALTMIGDTLAEADSVYTIVHETAHQWWYAAVGNNETEHAWLDEGLAEYSTLLFFEQYPEYGFTRSALIQSAKKMYQTYFSVQTQIFGEADTRMTRPLNAFQGDLEYVCLTYDKGVLLFDALRETLGKERFLAALAKFYKKYSGKIASPQNLKDCFKKGAAAIITSYEDGTAIL